MAEMSEAKREELEAEAGNRLRRLMIAVYLHYHGRRDLDPSRRRT